MLRKAHIASLLVGLAVTGGAIAVFLQQPTAENGQLSVSADVPVGTASLAITPATSTIRVGQDVILTVNGSTKGDVTRGVDLVIEFDPAILELIDADNQADGLQIKPGSAFDFEPANSVDMTNGTVRFSASQQPTSQAITLESTPIATLSFRAKAAGHSLVRLRHQSGSLADSNIIKAKDGRDLLNNVSSAAVKVQ